MKQTVADHNAERWGGLCPGFADPSHTYCLDSYEISERSVSEEVVEFSSLNGPFVRDQAVCAGRSERTQKR
jgi:hypothetical protein